MNVAVIDAETGEVAAKAMRARRHRPRRAQAPHHFTTGTVEEVRHELVQARVFCDNAWAAGRRVTWTLEEEEDHVHDWRRRFYHGHVLAFIADQARVGKKKERFPLPVWKEFFREKFLGYKWSTYLNPYTGKKHRRKERISSEDISDAEYAKLVEQVIAEASTELGVMFEFVSYETWRSSRQ